MSLKSCAFSLSTLTGVTSRRMCGPITRHVTRDVGGPFQPRFTSNSTPFRHGRVFEFCTLCVKFLCHATYKNVKHMRVTRAKRPHAQVSNA